ncbi:MAG: hypothetical protein RRZ84_06040 [Romboutsia sp.]
MDAVSKNKKVQEYADDTVIDTIKAFIYSFIGIFIFFVPIKLDGTYRTLLYHMSYKVQYDMNSFLKLCIITFIFLGFIKPFIMKGSKETPNKLFIIKKVVSLIIIANIFYGTKDTFIVSENTMFIIEEFIFNIATLLPLTSIFMVFLLNYGALEIVESFCHKLMKTTFKISGKTILNILIYISTDCFCGFFITNSMYKKGKLRQNEAIFLILNFSIASIPSISYVCSELEINKFALICTSLLILIISNAIICRIYPLNKKKKSYYIKTTYKETIHKHDKFKKGLKKYLKNKPTTNIFKDIVDNLEESFKVVSNLIPDIIIVLFIGDIIINSEFIIELVKYAIDPFVGVLKLIDAQQVNEFIISVFLNDILAIENVSRNVEYTSKFIISIIFVIKGISLSSNIIYMKNMDISISKKDFMLVYIERILLIMGLYLIIYCSFKGYNSII